MDLSVLITRNRWLKELALWAIMPTGQARPRRWIRWFINPFHVKKGKKSRIQKTARMDIIPNKKFNLGDHSTIEDFCTVNNGVGNVIIGNKTRVGINSVIIGPAFIGDDVRLAQNVVVSGLNHNYQDISKPIHEQGVSTEDIYIGDETWIGANSVVLPGVFIGKHCVIAAGSVVTKNIPSYCVAAGNPARIIKRYNCDSDQWEKATAL
jgi:acetyltransferase-like isoleucine patch superfamily enzyme